MADERAVSPVIGTLLILATFTIVATTVIMVGKPEIDRYQEQGDFKAVESQMGRAVADLRQLAVSGAAGEIRQPVVSFSKGHLQSDDGHWFAVTANYYDLSYTPGMATAPRPDVVLEPGWGPDAIALQFSNTGGSSPTRHQVTWWDGSEWRGHTHDVAFGSVLALPQGDISTLSDRTFWKINHTDNDLNIRSETFLFRQGRVSFEIGGIQDRELHAEAGGLVVQEHSRYRLHTPSMMRPPDAASGSDTYSLRSVYMDVIGPVSFQGRVKTGWQATVDHVVMLREQAGAAEVRIQMSGEHAESWYNQFLLAGYEREVAPNAYRGAWYAQDATAEPRAFPFNFIHAELDLRIRQR